MAIRYDKSFNKEITRVVHNFNQKRNRAIKRGYTHLPPRLLVSELKSRYTTKSELIKELKFIESFNKKKDLIKVVENEGGAKSIKWDYLRLKRNIEGAKKHYDRLIAEVAKGDTIYDIGKKHLLETYTRQREILDLDLSQLSQNDFNTFRATINKYEKFNYLASRSYKGFLSEVLEVIKYSGYSEEVANQFVEKFKVLTPQQFVILYNDSNLIKRVYDIADSPIHGASLKFNTDRRDAKEVIDALFEQTDEIIDEYKQL